MTDLRGANLENADLRGANLQGVEFDIFWAYTKELAFIGRDELGEKYRMDENGRLQLK